MTFLNDVVKFLRCFVEFTGNFEYWLNDASRLAAA